MADQQWPGRPFGRRQFMIGGAALLTAGAGLALVPRGAARTVAPSMLEAAIPMTLGGWGPVSTNDFILPLEDEGVEGVYGDILTRAYANAQGAVVMLVVAYVGGQTGTILVHRPEACYPANGYKLSNRAELKIADPASEFAFPAVCYTATSYERTEQLLYWTRIGKYFPVDWISEQLALVRSNLSGQLPDGVLVRASVISDDPVGSRAVLLNFAKALSERVTTVGRAVLFNGTGG
jgi:EpsI family protein